MATNILLNSYILQLQQINRHYLGVTSDLRKEIDKLRLERLQKIADLVKRCGLEPEGHDWEMSLLSVNFGQCKRCGTPKHTKDTNDA